MTRMTRLLASLAIALLLAAAHASAAPPEGKGQGKGNGDEPTHGHEAASHGNGHGNGGGHGHADSGGAEGSSAESGASSDAGPGPSHDDAGGQPADAGDGHPPAPSEGSGSLASPVSQGATHAEMHPSTRGNSDNAKDAGAGDAGTGGSGTSAAAAADGDGHGRPADAAGAAVADPAPAAVTPPVPVHAAAADELRVQRGGGGNLLSWQAPSDAVQVQLWRNDGAGWVPVAVATGAGTLVDAAATPQSQYRLTWSSEALAPDTLGAVGNALPLTPALRDAADAGGEWLVGLLWAGVGAFATVRARAPRRVLELRIARESPVLPVLAGLPGIDLEPLERVANLGLRTVGQLRDADAHALAFWAGLPLATVQGWHDTLDLLQWRALPPGAGERLALTGHTTMRKLAAADPAALHAELLAQDVAGPGTPAGPGEVGAWVAEARQVLGLPLRTPPSAAAVMPSAAPGSVVA